MERDKRAKFYTMPDLPREQYEENERLVREHEQREREKKDRNDEQA